MTHDDKINGNQYELSADSAIPCYDLVGQPVVESKGLSSFE